VNKTVSLIGENRTLCVIDAGGIGLCVVLVTKNNVNITGFTIQNSGGGIGLSNSSNGRISGNRIMRNEVGIALENSSNTMILANHISNNKYGIYFNLSRENTISANNISNNTYYGVGFAKSFNNTVSKNMITNSSGWWALGFGQSSNNTISGNNVTNNFCSVFLDLSSTNKFYNNNFIENTMRPITINSINTWNNSYPSSGNYWSDYSGTDSGGDGIGDTPYQIDENNTDYHPLMGMFSDFNATPEHNVQTICNSTISDFQFNGTAISFSVTGKNYTRGFCRSCIPTALMNNSFRVFVNSTEILPSPEPLPCSNSTHNYLYFTYNHSTQEVVVIPEFPSFLILPPFMIATLIAVIIYKRKHSM